MVFDLTRPLPNALVHFAFIIFNICCTLKSKKVQDYVSAYSKVPSFQLNKAFVEGYVKSKSIVKRNISVLVTDYFKKVHLEQFQEKKKSQETT